MIPEAALQEALGKLRVALERAKRNPIYNETIEAQPEVLARFRPVFSLPNVSNCEESQVKEFLREENNKHWSGLHRMGNYLCKDMPALRKALTTLVDEGQPLATRLTQAVTTIRGLGNAIATAILLVVYPDKYGVWNRISEAALRELGVWPTFDRGSTIGERYEQVNELLVRLAADLGIDLWSLDTLLWFFLENPTPEHEEMPIGATLAFGLERHLHEFLRDNWDQTELGREWNLHEENGDPTAGYEYPTDVGRIDLLARHRREPAWLVVELKREQTTDATIGQVQRYMGWVKRHLAAEGERVQGLIITPKADPALLYALEVTPNVSLRLYEVQFRLLSPPFIASIEEKK